MKKTTIILLLVCALSLLAVAGCDVSASRHQTAELRFERTMDRARMDAARRSLAAGRYTYARKVLEPCLNSPRQHDEAEHLMTKIETANHLYAQLNAYRDDSKEEQAY
jgi:hypothetical protein